MTLQQTMDDFAIAASARYGCDVSIQLDSRYGAIWHIIEADSGPLSHLTDQQTCINGDGPHRTLGRNDLLALEPDQRVELLLRHCDSLIAENAPIHDAIARALAGLPAEDAARLAGLRLRHTWGNRTRCYVDALWMGRGDDLQVAQQRHRMVLDGPDLEAPIAAALRMLAKRDCAREDQSARGLILDPPLRALLRDTGRNEAELVEAASRHGYNALRQWGDKGPGPMDFAGHMISLSFHDGEVRSEIRLNDKVRWSKGCLTARGVVLPDTVLASLTGQDLRKVVDHPWLEGLVITASSQTRNKAGRTCATFMTKVAA